MQNYLDYMNVGCLYALINRPARQDNGICYSTIGQHASNTFDHEAQLKCKVPAGMVRSRMDTGRNCCS